jgi:alkylation response protein AidB-like acyl-CoA dehydrogenase
MSLVYDDEQQAIGAQARRVLEAGHEQRRLLDLLETTGGHDTAFWEAARQQGWPGIAIPEASGGLGLGLVELGLVAHQVGRTLAGAPFLTGSLGVARALAARGDADGWLPRLASGEAIGAVAFAEGSEVLPTSSVRIAGGMLDGTKPVVGGGLAAHVALVLAQDGSEPVLALAVLDGVERTARQTYDNSRLAADLRFAATPARELARGPAALAAARDVLAAQAVVTAHEQTGGAEALMERARDYAVTRRAFGQPIGAFQSVKHRIAELYVLVELARANAIHAAACDATPEFLRAAAAARLSATEAYDTAARDAVQIHGGIGVTWESGLHLHMRRARTLANEQGNALFWEDLLVDELERAGA